MRLLTYLAVAAVAVATPLNITVLDQSPTIRYLPDRGVGNPRWQTEYEQNDLRNYTRGMLGRGASSHYTENVGSGFSFSFKGTAVYVYGSGAVDGYTMTLSDSGLAGATGTELSPPSMIGDRRALGWAEGLEDKWWTIDCNVTKNVRFVIQSIDFTVNIGPEGATLSTSEIPAVNDAVTSGNSRYSFSGEGGAWITYRTAGGVVYPRISSQVKDSRVTLPPVTGETFVLVYGPVNWNQRRFRVESTSPADGWPATTEWSAVSEYLGLDQVSWFGAVKDGTVSMQNLEGQQSRMDVAKVVYITASGLMREKGRDRDPRAEGGEGTTADSGSPNIGTIVGAVLGGIAALAAVGVLVIWLRRKKRKQDYWGPGHFDAPSRGLTPYEETQTMSADAPGHEMAHTGSRSGTAPVSHGVSPFPPSTQYRSDHSTAVSSSTNLLSPSGFDGRGPSTGHTGLGTQHQLVDTWPATPKTPAVRDGPPQEVDAGSLSAVPPSYNPAWAPSHSNNASTQMTSPATTGVEDTASVPSSKPRAA